MAFGTNTKMGNGLATRQGATGKIQKFVLRSDAPNMSRH
jgi:hypothetical protein